MNTFILLGLLVAFTATAITDAQGIVEVTTEDSNEPEPSTESDCLDRRGPLCWFNRQCCSGYCHQDSLVTGGRRYCAHEDCQPNLTWCYGGSENCCSGVCVIAGPNMLCVAADSEEAKILERV